MKKLKVAWTTRAARSAQDPRVEHEGYLLKILQAVPSGPDSLNSYYLEDRAVILEKDAPDSLPGTFFTVVDLCNLRVVEGVDSCTL
jgi:hypothetical protein